MFRGSFVALVTPMTADDQVDFIALTRLVDFHLQNQTDGIVVVGTTGESGTLTEAEHEKIIRHVVEQVGGKIPVIAGSGALSTQETIQHTQAAMELGVDGCLIMTPAYIKPTQEGLYQHFKTVADAVHVPIILYNVPGRTAVDLLPETVERLAACTNIVGIKEATGDINRAKTIIEACGSALDVLSGDDPLTHEMVAAGGSGVISVTANIAPKLMHELCVADNSEQIHQQLSPLFKALFLESNPIPLKWAMAEMGLIAPYIRLPMTELSETYQAEVREAMKQVGVIA